MFIIINLDTSFIQLCDEYTKFFFSVLRIGFSEDDYEGLEDHPNSPCVVTAVVTDSILEIPIQIQLTPRALSTTGKKCSILTTLQVV